MLTKNACDVLAAIAANEMMQKEAGFIGTAIKAGKHLFNPYTMRMVKGTGLNALKMLRSGWADDAANLAAKVKGIPGQVSAAANTLGKQLGSGLGAIKQGINSGAAAGLGKARAIGATTAAGAKNYGSKALRGAGNFVKTPYGGTLAALGTKELLDSILGGEQ